MIGRTPTFRPELADSTKKAGVAAGLFKGAGFGQAGKLGLVATLLGWGSAVAQ